MTHNGALLPKDSRRAIDKMISFFENETDLKDPHGRIRCRAYGTIEVIDGELKRIRFKPWPKLISNLEISLFGQKTHTKGEGEDRCLLYYNQPFFHRNYLALKYVVSSRGTSFRTFRLATRVLDEVARLKKSDAILCEVSNSKISERLLTRWGWEEHLPDSPGRHYIKRFYGKYNSPLQLKPFEISST